MSDAEGELERLSSSDSVAVGVSVAESSGVVERVKLNACDVEPVDVTLPE